MRSGRDFRGSKPDSLLLQLVNYLPVILDFLVLMVDSDCLNVAFVVESGVCSAHTHTDIGSEETSLWRIRISASDRRG